MMTVKELKEDFYKYTGKASEINRQLALAGIAIIWLFRNPNVNINIIPDQLFLPLLLLGFTLALDILQPLYQGITCYIMYLCFIKKDPNEDRTINENEKQTIPAWILYGLKIVSTFVAYYYIASYLIIKI